MIVFFIFFEPNLFFMISPFFAYQFLHFYRMKNYQGHKTNSVNVSACVEKISCKKTVRNKLINISIAHGFVLP